MADAARIQQRIAFLQRTRPGDPEIAQLQQRLKGAQAQPAAPAPGAPPQDYRQSGQQLQGMLDGINGQPPGSPPNYGQVASGIAEGVTGQPPAQPPGQLASLPGYQAGVRGVASAGGYGAAPGANPGAVDWNSPGSVGGAAQQEGRQRYDESLLTNLPNEQNALGGRRYTRDPETGQLVMSDSLSPGQQALFDAETGADATAAGIASGMLGGMRQDRYDPNSLKNGIPGANTEDRKKVEDSVYANLTQDFEGDQKQQREDFEQMMSERGIPVGSDNYKSALDRFEKGWDRKKLEARNQAIAAGGDEMTRQFGLNLQAHNTEMGDYQSGWSFPAALAGSLLGMGQGYQMPTFTPKPVIERDPVPYTDMYNVAGGIAAKTLDREQNNQQFQQTLKFDKKRWRGERAKRRAEVGALNRSNRGGGGRGGGGGDSSPGFGGSLE